MQNKQNNKRRINWAAISMFAFAIAWVLLGIKFIIQNIAIVGEHRNKTLNVVGGWSMLVIGFVFFYVAYHTLSPNGRIRSFVEDQPIRKRKK